MFFSYSCLIQNYDDEEEKAAQILQDTETYANFPVSCTLQENFMLYWVEARKQNSRNDAVCNLKR